MKNDIECICEQPNECMSCPHVKMNEDGKTGSCKRKRRMYSRDEVEELIKKFSDYADSCIDHDGIMNACCFIDAVDWDEDKWIKENLL